MEKSTGRLILTNRMWEGAYVGYRNLKMLFQIVWYNLFFSHFSLIANRSPVLSAGQAEDFEMAERLYR